jgi:hypothetical protein
MVIAQRDWRQVAEAESRRCLRQKAIKKIMLNALPGPGNNETGTGSFLTE